MIDVCLLGCGGSIPVASRALSATIIKIAGRSILIDCGEGTQIGLRSLHWGLTKIDLICLTHYHGDHLYGLFGLLSTIQNSGRTSPITILGPKGLDRIAECIKLLLPNLAFELIFYENPQNYLFNNLKITTLNLHHSAPCLGYAFTLERQRKFSVEKAEKLNLPKIYWSRLQKGEIIEYNNNLYEPDMVLGGERKGLKISFITDTRPTKEIPTFIENSDLFICEGMYGDDEDIEKALHTKHMTFKEAANLAKLGNVAEMVLTHFSPSLENPELFLPNAQKIFSNTIIGYEFFQKKLKFTD